MKGYNFTERTRKVLALAREEAARHGHEAVGPEHMLLGLVREGEGVAAAVLQNLNAELEDVRKHVEARLEKRTVVGQPAMDLPYTSQAKKVLELAMHEARTLKHSYVGTEHLLLGLLGSSSTVAGQVLIDELGVTLDEARAETVRLLGTDPETGERYSQKDPNGSWISIEIRAQHADGRTVVRRCLGKRQAIKAIEAL